MDRQQQNPWQPGPRPGPGTSPPSQGGPGFHRTQQPPFQPPVTPPFSARGPEQQKNKRPGPKIGRIIILAALAVLIALGGIFGTPYLQRFLQSPGTGPGTNGNNGQNTPQTTATQQAQLTPTPTERERYKQLAQQIVDGMSLEELIGQLMVVNPLSLYDLEEMIGEQHVSGTILYKGAFGTVEQSQEFISQIKGYGDISPFVAIDGEGGDIYRLINVYPEDPFLLGAEMRATGDPEVAADEGKRAAERFKTLGINVSFAPTVDVYESEESFMLYRSFGNTPEDVIKYAGPNLAALQQNGVIGTLKHFPGMGRPAEDPHMQVITVTASREEVYETDLAPFRHFVQSKNPNEQPGMIMPTYVLVPDIDPEQPAQFSHIFMTEILREEFGYDGVVITDALTNMQPAEELGIGPASILSLQAGCDLLLGARSPAEVEEVVLAIKEALNTGELTKERLEQSAVRILALKMQYKIMPANA